MARPIEFDRKDVVEKALPVFRKKGYNGTSMRELEAVTGLNPGSFYSAFGNKHNFFIETVRYFYKNVQEKYRELVEQNENPVDAIRGFYDYIVDCVVSDNSEERCCYVIKSALELATVDEKVHELVCEFFAGFETALCGTIQNAMDEGFISQSTNVEVTAKLLLNNLFGLNVNGMLRPQRENVETSVNKLFEVLLPTSH